MAQPKTGFKLNLSLKLGLPFWLLTLVTSGMVSYMVWSAYQLQIQNAQERQQQASIQAGFKIASYVNQFHTQLDDTARGLTGSESNPDQQRAWLERIQLAHSHFHEMAVTDRNGQDTARTILLTPQYLVPLLARSDTPAFKTASQGQFYLGRVYMAQAYNAPFVQMAVPVFDNTGDVSGVLLAEVDLSYLWQAVQDIQAGQDGFAYIVDEEGRLIAYRESELVQGPAAKLPRVAAVPAVASYLQRRAESARITERDTGLLCMLRKQCEPILTYYRPIEDTGWAVVVEQPTRSAYAQANRLLALALALAAIVLVILALLGWYIRRGVLRPIQLLSEGAAAFAGGLLTQRIAIHTGDEIEALANEFNSMAESLYQSQTQLEDYALTLEKRVEERTAELSQRATQLETSSQVARQVTSILDLDELLAQVVQVIQARFEYYFVGVWLISDNKENIILQSGAGNAADNLPQPGFAISMEAPSVIAQVCRTGLPLSLQEASPALPRSQASLLPQVETELALPLHMAGKTIGALDILSNQSAAFGPQDPQRVVLQTLADQIAIAIRNARLYQAEQQRRRLAESLEQAGRALARSLDLREVPGLILEQLAKVVPYERCSVMLQTGEIMRIVAQRGFPDDERVQELLVPIRRGDVFQQIAASGQAVLIDDVTKAEGWRQVEWLPLNLSWMGIPLVTQDRPIGMISMTRREAAAFSQEDAALAAAFAGQAVVALDNARLYDDLQKAYQVLERLNQTKSNFIEVAAHELRTPLTVIKGYTQVLAVYPAVKEDASAQAILKGIVEGAERLHEIVNSMLDVSKIDSQTMRMRQERIELSPIFENLQAEFAPALQERRLALTMQGLDALPPITADPDLLRKVFYHLIINAIKYTPDGGSIQVSGQEIPNPEGMRKIEIVVSDTGIGIDPEHHELIFEKFYQTGEVAVHSSGKTKFKGGGPGLGLAIAKGIVLAHGGTIWVQSEGHDEERLPGSHFHVRLPVEK